MNREELQHLERRASDILSDRSDIDPDTLSALADLHHDERVLGEVMWAVRGSTHDPRTAIAPIITWLGQTRTGSYTVGDFQRLLVDLGGREDHGHVGTHHLIWNHALESMVEKLGRETLLIDVKDLSPKIRQAFSFALVRRGFLSPADLSEEDAQAISAALVNSWSETSTFAREWMATAPTPEVGRMFAHTLATLPWSQPEPLAFAARFATPLETIQIALNMKDMALSEHVLDMLDARREDVFVALNGRTMSLWDRAFGPSFGSWGLGVAGIIIRLSAKRWPPGVFSARLGHCLWSGSHGRVGRRNVDRI
ncbi:MAG: hypothetical protein R3E66_11025 [bacterium]